MIKNLRIEIKIIIAFIVFTVLAAGIERYNFTNDIKQQFIQSKKSKNRLLINTILPIIKLNLSLGINEANSEYLQEIVTQNSDIKSMVLKDANKNDLFNYRNSADKVIEYIDKNRFNSITKLLFDDDIGTELGVLNIDFYDHDYEAMVKNSEEMSRNVFIMIFVLLSIFLYFIKREFRYLRHLSQIVTMYDPKKDNFTLVHTDKKDEVGIVHNAIVDLVKRVKKYSNELDLLNSSLEQKVKDRTEELLETNAKLKSLSNTDSLTKIYNRLKLEEVLNEQQRIANRYKTKFGLIIIDIDYFKDVNDTYGHITGDQVLIEFANLLEEKTRDTDIVGRWGGEEFFIISPNTAIKGLIQLAETLRISIEKHDFSIVKNKTASFGVTQYQLEESIDSMITRADDALYSAKKSGRNRVISI